MSDSDSFSPNGDVESSEDESVSGELKVFVEGEGEAFSSTTGSIEAQSHNCTLQNEEGQTYHHFSKNNEGVARDVCREESRSDAAKPGTSNIPLPTISSFQSTEPCSLGHSSTSSDPSQSQPPTFQQQSFAFPSTPSHPPPPYPFASTSQNFFAQPSKPLRISTCSFLRLVVC